MSAYSASAGLLLLVLGAAAPVAGQNRAGPAPPVESGAFEVVEATIGEIHHAMLEGQLTARQLVLSYIDRITWYDAQGPSLNAIQAGHPGALARADSLDVTLAREGRLSGPLHGIVFIVKDNFDVVGVPTTDGSALLARAFPLDDAFVIRRILEAGGIVLAKGTMAEFAFNADETIGSAWTAYTFNPYSLNRVPAGSSGGTAVAVAASFGSVGLGTDTGASIRGPASHTALVGIRPTMGLTSRDGIVPLYHDRDIGGPMTRTVEDAARVLDVIAGTDPADMVTGEADARRPASYLEFLDPGALEGARLGVVSELVSDTLADPRVMNEFRRAVLDLRAAGATVVDVSVPEIDTISGERTCPSFAWDIQAWLASLRDPPARDIDGILATGEFHPSVAEWLASYEPFVGPPERNETCIEAARNADVLRTGVLRALAALDLDAMIYPSWLNPPRLVGDLTSPSGNNSAQLAPPTGFPAITVPMGFVAEKTLVGPGLPVGLQFLGDAWSEPRLIGLAYAYEQATRHRKPPPTTPPLGNWPGLLLQTPTPPT
ncbi:MAG: amidase family protein [Gemmatimonadota bacterium]|jgi:Asp-tRNA(Asn)/Glu-tRNA(Gln) amidotransferase A subunit family amidase